MDYLTLTPINEPKNNKFIERIEYIVIFMLIYLSSSFVACSSKGTVIIILLYVSLFVYYIIMLLSGKNKKVHSNMALKMITLVAIIGMGAMSSRGDDIKQIVIIILFVVAPYLFALSFDFKNFAKKFCNIIYFLSAISLILYFIYIIEPSLYKPFPTFVNITGVKAKNLFFFTVYGGANARNQSIFWEPGAFQTYINLALLFELFYFKNITRKRLIVYVVALITTYSTAGYIAGLYIAYAYVTYLLFSSSKENKNGARNLFFILTVVLIAVIIFLSLDTSMSNWVFGKFTQYRETGYGTKGMTTVSVRFDAFLRPFKIFWQYPMFGAGTRGMVNFAHNEGYSMNTCTFMNFFAYFGVFYGAMMMKMFWDFSKRFSKNKLIVFMIFFAIFLITSTEDYHRNPSILVFIFFPFLDGGEKNKNENITQYQQW